MADSRSNPETSVGTSTTAIGLVIVAVAALIVGGALMFGIGPFGGVPAGGGGPADGSAAPTPADDRSGAGEASQTGNDPGASETGPDRVRPFTVSVGRIEECGNTCRDVTASITNNGGNPRPNVTVSTEIYAGGDRVWEGRRELGTLAPDETKTRTERVDVGFLGAAKIKGDGGNVTIVTTVDWSDGSATYRERRSVA